MAVDRTQIRIEQEYGPPTNGRWQTEPPIGELFRQLTEDATRLIKQEVALGKAELRQTASALASDATRLAVAAVLAILGALAATAFLIIGLGILIGSFWLSALLVALILLATAALIGKRAVDDMRERDLAPTETIETLQEDAEWARREARAVKRDWQS